MFNDLEDLVKDLKIGYSSIDDMHENILVGINTVCTMVHANKPKDEVLSSLFTLEKIVMDHFKIEEAVMERRKYAKLDLHRAEHVSFKEEFEKFKKAILKCNSSTETRHINDIKNLLVEWKGNHIKTSDRELGMFIRSAVLEDDDK